MRRLALAVLFLSASVLAAPALAQAASVAPEKTPVLPKWHVSTPGEIVASTPIRMADGQPGFAYRVVGLHGALNVAEAGKQSRRNGDWVLVVYDRGDLSLQNADGRAFDSTMSARLAVERPLIQTRQ